jgi:hypothetical protein
MTKSPNDLDVLLAKEYNKGIDTAIALVRECMDYNDRMSGTEQTIICGLESCKKKIDID